jgi:hypothetical protein
MESQFSERAGECVRQAPHRPRREFLVLRLEVEPMDLGEKRSRCLQFAIDEGGIKDQLCPFVADLRLPQSSTWRRIGSKFRCMRSTPTDVQSMSENDFECFASTGVNTPETMFVTKVDPVVAVLTLATSFSRHKDYSAKANSLSCGTESSIACVAGRSPWELPVRSRAGVPE